MRCFYRSGVECTADVADLLPAVRLALGHLSGDGDQLQGERLTYVRQAWARRGGSSAPPPRPVTSVVLDGELLVYDEMETKAGACDELDAEANPNPNPDPDPNPNQVRTTSSVPRRGFRPSARSNPHSSP